MKTTNNVILITGGGSGIGRGLAEAFHGLGNEVIIGGRSEKTLETVVAANPGMKYYTVDMTDPGSIRSFAGQVAEKHPSLNVLINNAGVMRPENLIDQPENHLGDSEAIIATNLLGPIRLTAALLPTLRKQSGATVMTVSSGLAFLPMALTPTYCATKAAIHSFSQTLRYQLRKTGVEVIELIPPYVQTSLMGDRQAQDPNAMPLDEFIAETIDILQNQPESKEVCVKRVHNLRFAAEQGQKKYDAAFQSFNDVTAAAETH